MYKIYNHDTGKYLIGYTGNIKWTTEDNARIFKRKEDVRNFLRFYVGRESGAVDDSDIGMLPYEWTVVKYATRAIGTKVAQYVLKEGII